MPDARAISALQRAEDLNCSSGSAWAPPQRVASMWQFLTRAPRFLHIMHFCLGFSDMLKLWEEEQPGSNDSWPCWRWSNDSEVELAHGPLCSLISQGCHSRLGQWWGWRGSQHALLTSNPDKGCSDFLSVPFSTKNVPNVHLLPSELTFPKHEWPGLVMGLLNLCLYATARKPTENAWLDTSDNYIYLVSCFCHTGDSS